MVRFYTRIIIVWVDRLFSCGDMPIEVLIGGLSRWGFVVGKERREVLLTRKREKETRVREGDERWRERGDVGEEKGECGR